MPTTPTHPTGGDKAQSDRLQKVLAAAGIGSRRQCEEYILSGRVAVDGTIVQHLGSRADPLRQRIEVDGEPIKPDRKRYFLLNKPKGYLCTNRDPAGRPRAVDLIPDVGARLFTVGRLDENSEGLILVTNDGELANQLAHPRYRIPKVYQVQVVGNPSRETLNQLRRGIRFSTGSFALNMSGGCARRAKVRFWRSSSRKDAIAKSAACWPASATR